MSVDANRIWFAEYARAEKERQGQSPEEVHRYAVQCAHKKRSEYLRRNRGKPDRQ